MSRALLGAALLLSGCSLLVSVDGLSGGATACFDCTDRSNYKGAVDELAVYEHSLSEERIKAHFAAAQAK